MDGQCLHVEVEIVVWADARVPILGPIAYAAALAPLSEAVYLAHGLRRNAPEVDQDDRVFLVNDGVVVFAGAFCYVPPLPVL